MRSVVLMMAVLFATLSSANLFACGESLYRVGKGVAYREYTAPLPGNLLIYAPAESGEQLAGELARTGHSVQVVASLEALTREIDSGRFDVVIAPYTEHGTIESSAGSSAIDFLPIALNREDAREAKATYGTVMLPEKHELKHYMKAIHVALKRRA